MIPSWSPVCTLEHCPLSTQWYQLTLCSSPVPHQPLLPSISSSLALGYHYCWSTLQLSPFLTFYVFPSSVFTDFTDSGVYIRSIFIFPLVCKLRQKTECNLLLSGQGMFYKILNSENGSQWEGLIAERVQSPNATLPNCSASSESFKIFRERK